MFPQEKKLAVWLEQYQWLKFLDKEKITLFPLQLVNCERLRSNNAVYIFDEVGCGKTISSGLMALDYLYHNQKEKVLIITANALSKPGSGEEYGQFLNDWYTKLPFELLGMRDRIEVINNHYHNIEQKALTRYGLIIIDEAHLFLNPHTLRHQKLRQLRCKKLVILTATPIKSGRGDLDTYSDIAQSMLEESPADSPCKLPRGQLICASFDPTSPVTRYFKEIVQEVNMDGVKPHARRLIPEVWNYSGTDKMQALLDNISQALQKRPESRFVVFVRQVENEAVQIKNFLSDNDFKTYEEHAADNTKTVKVVTGSNAEELADFKGLTNLPTVLIMTYQIAEQGVNLPGYNYVVNYHIPAYPAALEQRFGRIDRMGKNGSVFEEIHMSMLLSDDLSDRDNMNFLNALFIYVLNLLTCLPAKNTILTADILDQFVNLQKNFIADIESLLGDDALLRLLAQHLSRQLECRQACDETLLDFVLQLGADIYDAAALKKLAEERWNQLEKEAETLENQDSAAAHRIYDKNKAVKNLLADRNAVARIVEYLDACRQTLPSSLTPQQQKLALECLHLVQQEEMDDPALSADQLKEILKSRMKACKNLKVLDSLKDQSLGDDIFYISHSLTDGETEDHPIHTISAQDCADQIKASPAFASYSKLFKEIADKVDQFYSIRKKLNRYFEYQFCQNNLEKVFPFLGYADLIKTEIVQTEEICRTRQIEFEKLEAVQSQLDELELLDLAEQALPRLDEAAAFYHESWNIKLVKEYQQTLREYIHEKGAQLAAVDASLPKCLCITQQEFELLEQAFKLTNPECGLIVNDFDRLISSLPFFRMCEYLKQFVQGYLYTLKGEVRKRYQDIFYITACHMEYFIYKNRIDLGLSDNFIAKNWYYLYAGFFCLFWRFFEPKRMKMPTENDNTLELSNWYKLICQYSCKTAFLLENDTPIPLEQNPYNKNRERIFAVALLFKQHRSEESALAQYLYQHFGMKLADLQLEQPDGNKISLLQKFFLNGNVYEHNYKQNYRRLMKKLEGLSSSASFRPYDIWTRTFCAEVLQRRPSCRWSDLLDLPQSFQDYSIYNDAT